MTEGEHFPVVDFLVRLRKIDKQRLTVRDVIVLYAIMSKPGANGKEIARTIGIQDRSSIQLCLSRLMRHGFVEDRRTEARSTIPNILHVSPAGIDFWNDLKS